MIDKLREANWGTIKTREQDAISKKHLPKIKSFFRMQRDVYLKQFDSLKDLFPESSRATRTAYYFRLIEQEGRANLNDFNRAWAVTENETTATLQSVVLAVETDAMEQGGDIASKFFDADIGGTFNLDNPRAVNWFSQFGGSTDYIKGIQNTSKNQIKTIVTKALDEGWSYNKTATQIKEKFTDFTHPRAQLIATHESAQAYEAGNRIFVEGIADLGVIVIKMWMTSMDDKVTPECAANMADGWIALNESHTSGHQNPPRFPGCRCYEIFKEKGRNY